MVTKLLEIGYDIYQHLPWWRWRVIVRIKGEHREYTYNLITSLISASVLYLKMAKLMSTAYEGGKLRVHISYEQSYQFTSLFKIYLNCMKLCTRILHHCTIYILRCYDLYFSYFKYIIQQTMFLWPLTEHKYSSQYFSAFLWISNAPSLLLMFCVCNLVNHSVCFYCKLEVSVTWVQVVIDITYYPLYSNHLLPHSLPLTFVI